MNGEVKAKEPYLTLDHATMFHTGRKYRIIIINKITPMNKYVRT